MESKYEVRLKLKELLESKGISGRELSRMTDIRHPSVFEMIKNETTRLPLDNLAKICEVLGVDIPDVLELVLKESIDDKEPTV